jgi:hypothetical protein
VSGSRGQRGPELAVGEGFQGVELASELRTRQAALAEEPTEKLFGRAVTLARIALDAARNQIAVRIAPKLHSRKHMINAPRLRRDPPQAIKAAPTFARMDSIAQRLVFAENSDLPANPRCAYQYTY